MMNHRFRLNEHYYIKPYFDLIWLDTISHLFAFEAFRRDISGVAFVAVLFERILGVIYEPLWPGYAILAEGASEAIRVKLHILHKRNTGQIITYVLTWAVM